MLSRIQSLGSCLIVLTLLLFAGSAAAQDVSPRCEAAMDRAAGEYGRCLLRADAHNARHENATKLENRQTRCQTRFDRRTSRAFSRYGADECTSTELVAALADRTVTCAERVSTEAGGEAAASLLYVQGADGGTLTETTLTLTGVSLQTGWFTDRPYREAGRMTTAEFVALFSEEGANSFAEDPPNADFTCESGGEVVNEVVMLTEPVLDETADTLIYTTVLVSSAGDGDSFAGITCDADAHLFVDSQTATGAAHCTNNADCQGDGNYCKNDPTKEPPYYCKNPVPQRCFTPTELAAAESRVCTDGGGTWHTGTSTCTAASSYNCFLGGFCSQAATAYPPAQSEYRNVYTNHTPDQGAALAARCNSTSASDGWQSGHHAAGLIPPYQEGDALGAFTTYWFGICAGTYNCFIGGFCSRAAIAYPPAQHGYENAYTNDTPHQGAAWVAGCSSVSAGDGWQGGYHAAGLIPPYQEGDAIGAFTEYWFGICASK